MKEIVCQYINGLGEEQIHNIASDETAKVGYEVGENTARMWVADGVESETTVFPLSRVVFIREVTAVA